MILRTENLVKRYGDRTVVKDFSLNVHQGEIVGLLGPNGAGKTTTFYMVVGFIKPNEGDVFLENNNITALPMYKRARLGIGYLPQEPSVFRKLSVEDNIKAVLEMLPLSKEEQSQRLEGLIGEFGLERVRTSKGDTLSGGERRRTEIARALAVEDIQTIVFKLKARNIGILITDHNVQETLSITDRAYLMYDGAILMAGTAEELAEDEQVRRLYLGRNFELKRKVLDG